MSKDEHNAARNNSSPERLKVRDGFPYRRPAGECSHLEQLFQLRSFTPDSSSWRVCLPVSHTQMAYGSHISRLDRLCLLAKGKIAEVFILIS